METERALEAILMVADEPQSLVSLATALSVPVAAVRQSIERLVDDFDGANGGVRRGFELREVGGGWRIYVRTEFDEVVRDFVLTQNPTKLSQAALETLAVIAYNQPVTRSEIEDIRSVRCDRVVDTLLKHGLVRIAGRKKSVGSPLLFRTTERFLEIFGLAGISSLPSLDELKEYRSDDGVFDSLEGPDKVSEEDDSDEWIRQ